MTPSVLVVTSSGAPSAVVVPVLAALEASGLRVRAIDVGAAGGGGTGVADRVRRALLGETAERRLKKELESNPPDVAVAFDPHATLALTVARDQVAAPAPVIAVVGELEPAREWGATAADRFLAIDAESAVALADHGVEGDRILVVGTFGPRAWADAGREDQAALRARYKLGGQVALVDVAGMGAESTSSLAMQLSLSSISETTTFLFDAGDDVEAAATLRAKVPVLGLKAKLFGSTASDAPLLWRAADVVVARPRADTIAKTALVGARLVALVDDTIAGAAKTAAALEHRKHAVAARSPLLVASAVEALLKTGGRKPSEDGADTAADIVAVVAGDKRAVIEERRAVERAEAHAKVRAATSAAQSAARVGAAPGDLEDLSGGIDVAAADVPDPADLNRLVAETQARKKEIERAMMAARTAGETSRMHALLAELAQLDSELKELERAVEAARKVGARPRPAAAEPAAAPPPRSSVDDLLDKMKRGGPAPKAGSAPPKAPPSTVDDELAALKRKMEQTSKKKGT